MPRIRVGIHVHTEPERMLATLASVRANTTEDAELLLLPDGPDAATANALATLRDLPQEGTSAPLGVAACFNRLAASTDAGVLVLLESGAQVGPGWLGRLLAALEADGRNGLAGPSTNMSWNEQGVYPQRRGDAPEEVARAANDAARRFGGETRTLGPLYSLADFCYAVRREVVEAVGAADEGYGLGPCWEMDYNIRAARAGFRGVWACSAYVHRAPFTPRRRYEEARRFEASKRLYQDKFCGARLRGEKTDFRSHCRGDDCPNFAPSALIEIRRPPRADAISRPRPASPSAGTTDAETTPRAASSARPGAEPVPLASCIMPTYNRRDFIPQALRCFTGQDYPNLELIILDDGTDPVADCLPDDARIRYVRLDRKLTIGAKRNLACTQARGQFIVHWDDDDWYPSWRVRVQLQALIERDAELCGTSRLLYYDAAADRAWEYAYGARGAAWVAGNTLAYRKSFWERHKFPDIQIGEDSRFVWAGAGKKVCDLLEPSLCVAAVHPGNTSRKETDGSYWRPQPSERVHSLLGPDLHFYRASRAPGQAADWPLVSCIMPTYNRRPFIPLALRSFSAQDYPRKELVIIDDGDDAIRDLTQGLQDVRYFHLTARASIGAKRNLACRHAGGEIIAHWDDDDWYAPERLRYQVSPILKGEADITGLHNDFVLHLPDGDFWTTHPQLHKQMFVGDVHGGTLVYRRELLTQGLRYPEINLAEDAWLLHNAVRRGKRLLPLANPGVFVYVRHGSNAWKEFKPGRFINPDGWERTRPPHTFPAATLASYREAAVRV
jgi:glycosyltransferase involved in cell wall biosynthesis